MRLLFKVNVFVVALVAGTFMASSIAQEPSEKPLFAPTFYVAAEVVGCSQQASYIEFRGATNLPSGALIGISVVDIAAGGQAYSDEIYVQVVEGGFFAGKISPKNGMHFHYGLMLEAVFAPFRPKQPDSVLKVLGAKGEKLERVANISLKISDDLKRPAANPQLMHWSGDVYGLWATAVVPNCGEQR